ncbi:hypothetical protein Syun_001993 [Stephania yunnanensis]|uniref:Structural maintenance of chromosomes protein 5 n=1 Tax=Stephania yunnanensis TaxID=152371 RepID=A0AAP0Q7M9_9MAGN
MAERSAKRAKLSKRGEDDYLPGNITEIELKNFMTFDELKCKPGSRLNLVIGPNGSGKSSLVCAIALGLGGEPQLLGRASSVGAYVKRGEESGFVKISLRGETESDKMTITRKIDTRNKSEWLFNGRPVPKKDVLDIIQKFNIQVNNLTQFLPQDRVCEFAKLTPVQLLEETEKAIGDPQLPFHHCALIEKSREFKRLEVTIKQNGDTLNQLKALNSDLEKDVERVRQREQFLAKVEYMKKKLPWLKYDQMQQVYLKAKEKENEAKKKLDLAAKILNDLKEPIEKQKKGKAAIEGSYKKISNLISNNARRLAELVENENRLGVQVRGKYDDMEELRRQEESRQLRISKAREELADAERELSNTPIYNPPTSEIEALNAQILEFSVSIKQKTSLKSEKDNLLNQNKRTLIQCKDRLKGMENMNNKLLQALRNSGTEKIFEAYNWLQEHRSEMNKEVYGPILLEVNVPKREHAAYLENHIPHYVWKSFITQDAADRDFLVRNMRSFDIPVLNYVGDRDSGNSSFEVTGEMRKLGIYSRLDQVFDAPAAVKKVLSGQFGLEHSYIGSRETDLKADMVPDLGIHYLWTPDNHYRWTVSRYGGHVSASVESVSPSRLFLCGVDTGEIERLRSKVTDLEETISDLEGNIKTLHMKQMHLENEAAKLYKQQETIINMRDTEKRKRREIESRVNQKRKKLEALEKEEDADGNIRKLVDQVTRLNAERFQCAVKIKNLLTEAISYKWSYAAKYMESIELDVKIKELESGVKNQERLAVQVSLDFEKCKEQTETCRTQLAAAKRHAESIAIITPELAQEFLEMPATIEDLEAAIQDNISQANSIFFLNHNVLEEYESRRKKIESISSKLEEDEEELKSCLTEIDTLKENWLSTLRNLVTRINNTFSRNFQEMAVAGEVLLDEHGVDFDKYGILVRVKFRKSGQLQVLSAHHQSGGERSVSTILYLVSLQDLTNCPFRVVDEINQGMDPINERKMFQQLVRAASQRNTPQCFLLTPKLLPDLEYSEVCSILNIMNGPWIEKPSKAWSIGESWGEVTSKLFPERAEVM